MAYENLELTQRIAACDVVMVNSQTYPDCQVNEEKSNDSWLLLLIGQQIIPAEYCSSFFQSTVLVGS